MSEHTESPRRLAVSLTTASFAVLFQELALIRWLPGQVRVLAYFPNLVLLGTFLGLGLGCLGVRRRPLGGSGPWASRGSRPPAGP